MHPRNPYRQLLDFASLAEAYEPLKPHLKPTRSPTAGGLSYTIDFKNSESQRQLTKAILYRDFGLRIALPDHRLCPPVPNSRLNYILWLQDIIKAHDEYMDRPASCICGLDIGTGASAIYLLLGCRVEPSFRFIGTELDDISFSYATQNVESNGLSDRIHLIKTTSNDPILLPFDLNPAWSCDFTMCNPPFYESEEEMARSAQAKELAPNAVCTGAQVEMVTPGGELAFVSQIVKESLKYTTRCRWYTSMLGKLSSLTKLVGLLREYAISNYAITEFVQGQTRRWAVAWSFGETHLPDSVARISNPTLQPLLPERNTSRHVINISLPPFSTRTVKSKQSIKALSEVLSQIKDVTVQRLYQVEHLEPTEEEEEDKSLYRLLVYAKQNMWSRSARRQRGRETGHKANDKGCAVGGPLTSIPATLDGLLCGIEIKAPLIKQEQQDVEMEFVFQWVHGQDRSMFESFVNHVTRKMKCNIVLD
ncbi:hypothetical protein M378DRAFT_89211 [Amanita muscaria Koide BX008]|uniref:U6 small nuclear RNA (adenine-(43)-N(6))-methyltransferase n=1 Tax=Amanita muscaria (strain Koide BX008) TaxID=946122 RepID=A0A0C2SR72_AMAMK|nr:hypothetical protein M378DRAFT_89211 [Amanita muscaria Koide BX008]